MDPAKVKAWQRFYNQILSRSDWPRDLWFAAVEDRLRAAFGSDSRLLAGYRAGVDELLRLERAATGSYHDEKRRGQLEAQIKRLIDFADETIMRSAAANEEAQPPAPVAKTPGRPRLALRHALSALAGVLLLLAGMAGAAAWYEIRMAALADQQLAQLSRLLDRRVAEMRGEVDRRLAMADRTNQRMAQLQDELNANIDDFSATMTESARSMTALSDQTAELERRLAEQGQGVGDSLAELHERAAALARGLDEVGQELSTLKSRLPELRDDVERIGSGVRQMGTDFEQTAQEIEALKARPPELNAWLAGQQKGLEQALQNGRRLVGSSAAQVHDLAGEVKRSRERLQGLDLELDQSLQQAKLDGAALGSAVQEMRGMGAEVEELMAGAEAKVAAAQAAMQAKIDQILTELAEQADLAALRGRDLLGRAQSEIDRRVESESRKVLEELAAARDAQLAALVKEITATQSEIEQTRAGLLTSWQRMDQAMAERQGQVMAGLDGYASTLEARVEEFLHALDVMVARTGG
jgi:chromosome segregation ATPase